MGCNPCRAAAGYVNVGCMEGRRGPRAGDNGGDGLHRAVGSYGSSQLTTLPPATPTRSRPVSYYILLRVSALALFAISMFLTILVLR